MTGAERERRQDRKDESRRPEGRQAVEHHREDDPGRQDRALGSEPPRPAEDEPEPHEGRHDERLVELQQDQRVGVEGGRDGRTAWIAGPRARGSATPRLPIPGSTTGARATTRRCARPRARPIHTQGRRSGARSSSLARTPTSASERHQAEHALRQDGRAERDRQRDLPPGPPARLQVHPHGGRDPEREGHLHHEAARVVDEDRRGEEARRRGDGGRAPDGEHADPPGEDESAERQQHRREPRGEVALAEGVEGPGDEPEMERGVLVRGHPVPGDGVDAAAPGHLHRLARVEGILQRGEAQVPHASREQDQRGEEEDHEGAEPFQSRRRPRPGRPAARRPSPSVGHVRAHQCRSLYIERLAGCTRGDQAFAASAPRPRMGGSITVIAEPGWLRADNRMISRATFRCPLPLALARSASPNRTGIASGEPARA